MRKFCIYLLSLSAFFLVSVENFWHHLTVPCQRDNIHKTIMKTFALSFLLVFVITLSGEAEAKLVKVGDFRTIFHDVKGSVYIKVGWEKAWGPPLAHNIHSVVAVVCYCHLLFHSSVVAVICWSWLCCCLLMLLLFLSWGRCYWLRWIRWWWRNCDPWDNGPFLINCGL